LLCDKKRHLFSFNYKPSLKFQKMKKINFKSLDPKELLSRDELIKITGGSSGSGGSGSGGSSTCSTSCYCAHGISATATVTNCTSPATCSIETNTWAACKDGSTVKAVTTCAEVCAVFGS